jgi:hypothetical protein
MVVLETRIGPFSAVEERTPMGPSLDQHYPCEATSQTTLPRRNTNERVAISPSTA